MLIHLLYLFNGRLIRKCIITKKVKPDELTVLTFCLFKIFLTGKKSVQNKVTFLVMCFLFHHSPFVGIKKYGSYLEKPIQFKKLYFFNDLWVVAIKP